MSAFISKVEGEYILQVPLSMTISIRGLHLMLRDFTREYDGTRPKALLMSRNLFSHLCTEAARSHTFFSDSEDATTPRFEGVPIGFVDAGRMDNLDLVGVQRSD